MLEDSDWPWLIGANENVNGFKSFITLLVVVQ